MGQESFPKPSPADPSPWRNGCGAQTAVNQDGMRSSGGAMRNMGFFVILF